MENKKPTGKTTILFNLGVIVCTPGAYQLIAINDVAPRDLLMRHLQGDWGCVCEEDKAANFEALRCDARVLSAYKIKDDEKVWIITEADRSSTTILLPSEY